LAVLPTLAATDQSDAGMGFSALFDYLNALRIVEFGDIPGKVTSDLSQAGIRQFWINSRDDTWQTRIAPLYFGSLMDPDTLVHLE
jgi:hypothetical protein